MRIFGRITQNIYMGGTKELFTGEERMRQKPRKRIKKVILKDIAIIWVNVVEPFY
jgi:hypothetical protein